MKLMMLVLFWYALMYVLCCYMQYYTYADCVTGWKKLFRTLWDTAIGMPRAVVEVPDVAIAFMLVMLLPTGNFALFLYGYPTWGCVMIALFVGSVICAKSLVAKKMKKGPI